MQNVKLVSFSGRPSVTVHSGLPDILSHRRWILAGQRRGGHLGLQRRPGGSAQQQRLRGQDPAVLQRAAGSR